MSCPWSSLLGNFMVELTAATQFSFATWFLEIVINNSLGNPSDKMRQTASQFQITQTPKSFSEILDAQILGPLFWMVGFKVPALFLLGTSIDENCSISNFPKAPQNVLHPSIALRGAHLFAPGWISWNHQMNSNWRRKRWKSIKGYQIVCPLAGNDCAQVN